MIMVGAVILGAGTGYLTTKQTIPGTAEAAPTITRQPNDLYSRLGSNSNSSSDIYTPGPSAPSDTTSSTPKPNTSKTTTPVKTVPTPPPTTTCDTAQKTNLDTSYTNSANALADPTSP